MSGTSILKQFGGFTKISVEKFIDWLKSNQKNIKQLSFQGEGKDNGEAFSHYIKDFINSANLEETQYLNLNWCEIDDGVIEALLEKSHTLKELTHLILKNHKLSAKGIEALAQLQQLLKIRGKELQVKNVESIFSHESKVLYDFLKNEYKNQSSNTVNADSIKKMIFDIARSDNTGNWVKYILQQSEKYPFLINSRNEHNENMLLFYNHSPEMKKFLFNHGLIPEEERNQRRDDEHIVQDNQSVHASPIIKRTNFFAKKLVESTKDNKKQLKQAADSYLKSIEQLKQYQNDPVRLRLLNLTDNEKRSVMERTLNGHHVPDDKGFIKTVIDKAKKTLEQEYLRKNSRGEYDDGYPTNGIQYDYARDDAKITIPESIGCIKLLIDNFSIPLKEKKELLVTLMEQNPELVREKLPIIRKELGNSDILNKVRFEKTELYILLNSIDDSKKIDKLFKEISGLGIEKVWREQKEFILLKQIYIAATTYGKDRSACIQGTWSQIISSINEISSEIVAQCDHYLEEEQKLVAQKNAITEENIKPFMEDVAEKLIQHVKLHPELKETLEDFVVGIVDIDKPEEITLEQQKILAEINEYLSENIKGFLPNYNRNIPGRDEYCIIINGLSEIAAMQRFAQVGQGPSNSDHIGNEECSATIPENQGSFGNIGSHSIPYSSEEKALLNTSASNNKQGIQSEVLLSESESEDDKSDITVILADTKKEKQAPTQPDEQADSITRKSTQPKPVTNEQDISAKDNSKSKLKENNVTSQNKKMYILVTSALVVAGIVSGIAIAVYSRMLAVGITVGVLCLAAAITYYYNGPANSLENSNAEVVVNHTGRNCKAG